MNALATDSLARLALHSLQLAIVVGCAFGLSRLVRHRAAAARHALWAAAVVVIALLPLATALLPRLVVPVPQRWLPAAVASNEAGGASTRDALRGSQPPDSTLGDPTPTTAPMEARGSGDRVPRILLLIYVVGAGCTGARLVAGIVAMRRLWSRSRPVSPADGLVLPERITQGRAITIRSSESIATPITFGLLRPVIMVPAEMSGWPPEMQRGALVHEVAHVERLDWPLQLLARALCCVYWFHPLAWLAARELMLESEQACDDQVLGSGVEAPGYAEQLVAWTRHARKLRRPDAAMAMAGRHSLHRRIRSILDDQQERVPMRLLYQRLLFASVLVLGAAVASVGLALPEGETREPAPLVQEPVHGNAGTPLMRAAAQGDADAVRRLLAQGARVDETLPGLGSALIHAAASGHAGIIEILLLAGADPNLVESDFRRPRDLYRTALASAARSGRIVAVERLLEAGARVDRRVAGDPTALMVAARGGHIDIVTLLLRRGADPDRRVPGDGTPLIAAARGGVLEVVRLLVEAGGDVNGAVPGDGNPLIAAVVHDHRDIVRYLLNQGADPRRRVPGDESALEQAASRGDEELLRLFLDSR